MKQFALVVAGALVACGSTKRVAGPDGREQVIVRCGSTEDCYDLARDECGGVFDVVSNHATSVSHPASFATESAHEMVVRCGSRSEESSGRTETATASAPAEGDGLSKMERPSGAAGFDFDMDAESAQSACEGASHVWERKGSRGTCSGTPIDTGLGASAKVTFCADTVCGIELSTRAAGTSERDWMPLLAKVKDALEENYGQPGESDVRWTGDCRQDGLHKCLEDGGAHFHYRWRWKDRSEVSLRLGGERSGRSASASKEVANATEPVAIKVRYGDGRVPSRKRRSKSKGGLGDVSGL
jgi:hypothetical protein